MKPALQPGLSHELTFVVPVDKTVPRLYPESPEFRAMPAVFATGFLVGLLEWACMLAVQPCLDEGQISLGTHIDVSHCAATPPGREVSARVELVSVQGRRLRFKVSAHDGRDLIGEGWHERTVVDKARFEAGLKAKAGEERA